MRVIFFSMDKIKIYAEIFITQTSTHHIYDIIFYELFLLYNHVRVKNILVSKANRSNHYLPIYW